VMTTTCSLQPPGPACPSGLPPVTTAVPDERAAAQEMIRLTASLAANPGLAAGLEPLPAALRLTAWGGGLRLLAPASLGRAAVGGACAGRGRRTRRSRPLAVAIRALPGRWRPDSPYWPGSGARRASTGRAARPGQLAAAVLGEPDEGLLRMAPR
jgi:hypothetical protein